MHRALLLLLLIGSTACGDKKEAHLEHFRGAAALESTAANEPVNVFALAEDPSVMDRIAAMPFSEVAQRLGAHRYQAQADVESSSKEERLGFSENDLIVVAGNGDFRAKVDNDAGQGFELVVSGGRFFLKNRYSPFHERSLLSGEHLKGREMAYGAFGSLHRLFRGRLAYTKQGLAKHNGRDALRFLVSLAGGGEQPRLPGTKPPPQPPPGVKQYMYPIQETPADRDRFRDLAQPQSAQGSLLLDTETGVLLQAEINGKLSVASPEGTRLAMQIHLRVDTDGFGNPPTIPPPTPDEVKPIPERTRPDTHPLDFYFGKGFTATLGPPAGVAAPPQGTLDGGSNPAPQPGGPASNP